MSDPRKLAQAALRKELGPAMKDLGFEGRFPKFRRLRAKRSHVLWVTLQTGWLGGADAGLADLAARAGATVTDDYERAIGARNRKRELLTSLLPEEAHLRLWYEDARAAWGADWPEELAAHFVRCIEDAGEAWWSR